MAKFKFEKNGYQREDEKPVKTSGHGPCEVYGCPMPGHIYTSNWNCRYHHGKSGESLARITGVLRGREHVFLWHGKLLQTSIVDWDIGEIEKRAPLGMQVNPGETYQQYKARIFKHVEDILK